MLHRYQKNVHTLACCKRWSAVHQLLLVITSENRISCLSDIVLFFIIFLPSLNKFPPSLCSLFFLLKLWERVLGLNELQVLGQSLGKELDNVHMRLRVKTTIHSIYARHLLSYLSVYEAWWIISDHQIDAGSKSGKILWLISDFRAKDGPVNVTEGQKCELPEMGEEAIIAFVYRDR